ncbi:hypothetical protein MJI47_30445, partial [Salmonella enterica subsp. enterica serovar Kentucky]|nr:hypothetical protein [Salmonella enterica subsp. enterica serovar Kentucky]
PALRGVKPRFAAINAQSYTVNIRRYCHLKVRARFIGQIIVGDSWAIYDDTLPEKGRGNVRWRTLIEQMLNRGGPRLYQKPAVTR